MERCRRHVYRKTIDQKEYLLGDPSRNEYISVGKFSKSFIMLKFCLRYDLNECLNRIFLPVHKSFSAFCVESNEP